MTFRKVLVSASVVLLSVTALAGCSSTSGSTRSADPISVADAGKEVRKIFNAKTEVQQDILCDAFLANPLDTVNNFDKQYGSAIIVKAEATPEEIREATILVLSGICLAA